jgi:hypothetical protein
VATATQLSANAMAMVSRKKKKKHTKSQSSLFHPQNSCEPSKAEQDKQKKVPSTSSERSSEWFHSLSALQMLWKV